MLNDQLVTIHMYVLKHHKYYMYVYLFERSIYSKYLAIARLENSKLTYDWYMYIIQKI